MEKYAFPAPWLWNALCVSFYNWIGLNFLIRTIMWLASTEYVCVNWIKFVREGNVSNCEIHYLSMKAYRNIANEKPWGYWAVKTKTLKAFSLSQFCCRVKYNEIKKKDKEILKLEGCRKYTFPMKTSYRCCGAEVRAFALHMKGWVLDHYDH